MNLVQIREQRNTGDPEEVIRILVCRTYAYSGKNEPAITTADSTQTVECALRVRLSFRQGSVVEASGDTVRDGWLGEDHKSKGPSEVKLSCRGHISTGSGDFVVSVTVWCPNTICGELLELVD